MIYSISQLQALAASVGFPDPALAAAIAMAESSGNECAQGDPNIGMHMCSGPNGTSSSFGLWQVHAPAHPQYNVNWLLTADYNARAALEISRAGQDFRPWSTFTSGKYRQFLEPYAPGGVGAGTIVAVGAFAFLVYVLAGGRV